MGLAEFRTLPISFRYKSVELVLWQIRYLHLAVLRFRTRLLRFFDLRYNVACPRPDVSHPRSGRLRRLARPRYDECGCGVRTVEALRCPDDAMLSREHADQFRG